MSIFYYDKKIKKLSDFSKRRYLIKRDAFASHYLFLVNINKYYFGRLDENMYTLYKDIIEVNEINDKFLSMYIGKTKETFMISFEEVNVNKPYYLTSIEMNDQLIFKCEMMLNDIYIYSFENKLYYILTSKDSNEDFSIYDIKIKNEHTEVKIERDGFVDIYLKDNEGNCIVNIDDFFTDKELNLIIPYKLETTETNKNVLLISIVKYKLYTLVVKYYINEQQFHIRKVLFEEVLGNPNLLVSVNENSRLVIENKFNGKKKLIPFNELKNESKKIFGKGTVKKYFNDCGLIGIYKINKRKYYIYTSLNGIFIIKRNPTKATNFKSNLRTFATKKNLFIYGRMVHHAYNSFGKFEELYTTKNIHLATFKRPFRKLKFLKQFGYYKIPIEKLDVGERVHYPLYIGSKDLSLHSFSLGKKPISSKYFTVKKFKDKVLVIRTNVNKLANYSIVPYIKMYSRADRFKITAAYYISKIFYKNKKYNVNLFFEKQASKADESGFRVFEKVKEEQGLQSKNYFILDENASAYPELKKRYKNDLIKRFSFKHYLAVFNADYFISSDLSNHVINDRIFNNKLMEKIKETPLIFLQHGIMFAKPVENPLGKIFYKDYTAYNIYKNIVNSKLEAQEFYKMGYTDEDLLYTGLATFDYAKLDKTSDKIVYMPTYRYWEEGMIYSGEIEKTTYFKSLIKVINAFEKAGLRDKLMIVSHNKFAEYIKESMTDYQDVLGENPSEALKVGRIFISDFSSAIYDAIYRGAYPIFYWEDKDYLTVKYKATPPVNETNAPGPIAWSAEELVEIAKRVINQNYELEKEYIEKYRQINSFHDNKNTERIVKYLKDDRIL